MLVYILKMLKMSNAKDVKAIPWNTSLRKFIFQQFHECRKKGWGALLKACVEDAWMVPALVGGGADFLV